MRTTIVSLLLTLALLPAGHAQALETVTYDVQVEGDVQTERSAFAQIARLTFTDDRSWNLGGTLQFQPVDAGGDFHLILASPDVVDRAAPGCSQAYSCTVGDDVYVNDENFRRATQSWRDSERSLRDYQSYVILHETGHWLELDHPDDCPDGEPAPVMLQQSISLEGCLANTWPVREERETVAARYGEEILTGDRYPSPLGLATFEGDWDGDGRDEPGRFDDGRWWLSMDADDASNVQELTYGRAGDIPVVGDWDGDGDDTIGVVRGNQFILRNQYRQPYGDLVLRYGQDHDLPVVGDWDGDGDDTIGVVRGNQFILRNQYRPPYGDVVLRYGFEVDSPVTGDYDGDGDDTVGVVRDARTWILRNHYSKPYGDLVFTWPPHR